MLKSRRRQGRENQSSFETSPTRWGAKVSVSWVWGAGPGGATRWSRSSTIRKPTPWPNRKTTRSHCCGEQPKTANRPAHLSALYRDWNGENVCVCVCVFALGFFVLCNVFVCNFFKWKKNEFMCSVSRNVEMWKLYACIGWLGNEAWCRWFSWKFSLVLNKRNSILKWYKLWMYYSEFIFPVKVFFICYKHISTKWMCIWQYILHKRCSVNLYPFIFFFKNSKCLLQNIILMKI